MEYFDIIPSLFKDVSPPVRISTVHESCLSPSIITDFLQTEKDGIIGMSPMYGDKCILNAIAFATSKHVLFVQIPAQRSPRARKRSMTSNPGRNLLCQQILSNPNFTKCGFKMDTLSSGLFLDLGVRIVNGVDMLSLSGASRDSFQAVTDALGGETVLNKMQAKTLLSDDESSSTPKEVTAVQAWALCHAASLPDVRSHLQTMTRIDTRVHSKVHMDLIAGFVRNAQRFELLKPRRTEHEVNLKDIILKKGKLQVISNRFKTRIMPTGGNQTVEIERIINGKRVISEGRSKHINGRSATIAANDSTIGTIKSITTVGKESPTMAESLRTQVMLSLLRGTATLFGSPFIQKMFISSENPNWNGVPPLHAAPPITSARDLNKSQERAVKAILSAEDHNRIVLIQGPPGTGKTTVIAATTTSISAANAASSRTQTLWLVAQSNVAVKNIAEKLANEGYFGFSILVSKDFHYDWHEHLYGKLINNLIRSDDFAPTVLGAERHLRGHRVILCTLSMLSNDRLAPYCIACPPQTLIFDEASQIELGGYCPMFHLFQKSIIKLVFIGDDKQLPPYGQSDIKELKSIFQMRHLLSSAVLLNIQYRMPVPIGDFISKKVYANRLKSSHTITTPSCCRFVDIRNSKEIANGKSWRNDEEIKIVVALARNLHTRGLSYKIITPYDPQRSSLEKALQAAKIPHEDKCFNVDSFQGNEDDYIIISPVRSAKLGFLTQRCRMNVMLTRCKKGMYICTNRSFIQNIASETLVGQLAATLGKDCWISSSDVLNNSFSIP